MLVLTGVMLGGVLLVMVGEQVQEMQQAGWMSATQLHLPIPGWMGMWFAIFPNVEGLAAQTLAGAIVIGSYYLARRGCKRNTEQRATGHDSSCVLPDCEQCGLSK